MAGQRPLNLDVVIESSEQDYLPVSVGPKLKCRVILGLETCSGD